MKKTLPFFFSFLLIGCINNEKTTNENTVELNSYMDSISYALGTDIYKQISYNFSDIDFKILQEGINNKRENSNVLMDSIKCQEIIEEFMKQKQQEMMQQQQQEMMQQQQQQLEGKSSYEEIIKQGEDFLAKNTKRKGVITTKSGLQYEIVTKGKGPKPSLSNEVETHYHGTLIDGTVFDSSIDRGETLSFPVNGVIPGWTEALLLMNVGSKWKLYVPYQLAYGERGTPGGPIGPYSTLIFDIELINIK